MVRRTSLRGDWTNRYYGTGATDYDRARCHSLRWAKEQLAVNDFVFSGPVLDVPVGTGRFVPIYRGRNLRCVGVDISPDMLAEAARNYPGLELRQGDIFALPFADKQFATAVCVRLLDWLTPDEMALAIAELRRVAAILVLSIRYGREEWRVNQTHDLSKFYDAVDGLHIWRRVVTETSIDGIEIVARLHPPTWEDVLDQFSWHGPTPQFEIERLARAWFGNVGIYTGEGCEGIQPAHIKVSAEYWSTSRLVSVIEQMGEEHDWDLPDELCYVTTSPPRYWEDGPATILTQGRRSIVLDGRRRIGQWRRGGGGKYPVLHLTTT